MTERERLEQRGRLAWLRGRMAASDGTAYAIGYAAGVLAERRRQHRLRKQRQMSYDLTATGKGDSE